MRALWAYDEVLERDPANRRALRLKALAAASLGIPQVALELASRHPGLLSKAEIDRIEADRIALHVRWGELPPLTRGARFAEIDEALRLMDEQYRGDWSRLDLSVPKHRRLAFDRMVALRDRSRMTEVVNLHQQLAAAKLEIPDFALLAAGSAYLFLEQPDEALPIFEQVIEHDPANFNARMALFYTYVELDDFGKALAAIDTLNTEQPAWLKQGKQSQPNPKRLMTEIAAASGRAFADDLAGAQERFESMLTIAPENTEIRQDLATVYRWRGWPERALAEYDYIRMREPDYLDNAVQLATTELALGLYSRAEAGTGLGSSATISKTSTCNAWSANGISITGRNSASRPAPPSRMAASSAPARSRTTPCSIPARSHITTAPSSAIIFSRPNSPKGPPATIALGAD